MPSIHLARDVTPFQTVVLEPVEGAPALPRSKPTLRGRRRAVKAIRWVRGERARHDPVKILLMTPPSWSAIPSPGGGAMDRAEGHYPPLGLLYLAASVEAHRPGCHEIRTVDGLAIAPSPRNFRRLMRESQPQLVGITANSWNLCDALEAARIVKQENPLAIVAFGGPHATLYPRETAALGPVDVVARGEAERSFPALVDVVANGRDLSRSLVPGIVGRSDGSHDSSVETCHVAAEDLDALPIPDRNLLWPARYYSPIGTGRPFTTMVTSRGCRYHCTFCTNARTELRLRSVDSVMEEMTRIHAMGIREVYIYDNNFDVDAERVAGIAEALLSKNLALVWSFRGRVNHVDRRLLPLMRHAGCVRVNLGVESGTPRILRQLRKGTTLGQIREAFARYREAGIATLGYFMLGFPGETESEMARTVRLAIELDPNFALFFAATAYPGTEIYEQVYEPDETRSDPWQRFAERPEAGFEPPLCTSEYSPVELRQKVAAAHRAFYLRPRAMVRGIRSIRNAQDLLHKAHCGVSLLRM